jgi:soluble lytic murein transglycosylase-like protein
MTELLLAIIAAILGTDLIVKNRKSSTSTDTPDNQPVDVGVEEFPSVPFGMLFSQYSRQYNFPMRIAVSIVDYESNFNPLAINYEKKADLAKGHDVDSVGLGQILYPDTAVSFDSSATKDKLMNPEYNLNIMFQLLNQLRQRFKSKEQDGFMPDLVAAYNAGSPRRLPDGSYKNQDYVDSVRERYVKWRNL